MRSLQLSRDFLPSLVFSKFNCNPHSLLTESHFLCFLKPLWSLGPFGLSPPRFPFARVITPLLVRVPLNTANSDLCFSYIFLFLPAPSPSFLMLPDLETPLQLAKARVCRRLHSRVALRRCFFGQSSIFTFVPRRMSEVSGWTAVVDL